VHGNRRLVSSARALQPNVRAFLSQFSPAAPEDPLDDLVRGHLPSLPWRPPLSTQVDRAQQDLNESIGCQVAPTGSSYTKTWTAPMAVTGYDCAARGPRCRSCPLPRNRGRPDRRAHRSRIRQDPRARAHGHQVLPALPPERPRGAAPWLVPARTGRRGARLLEPSATLELALKHRALVVAVAQPAAGGVAPSP
jgi:hypothetical protein